MWCGAGELHLMPSLHDEMQTMYKSVQRGSPHIMAAASVYSTAYTAAADDQPPLIPKIIHQTYKSADVPEHVKPYMLVGGRPSARLAEQWCKATAWQAPVLHRMVLKNSPMQLSNSWVLRSGWAATLQHDA